MRRIATLLICISLIMVPPPAGAFYCANVRDASTLNSTDGCGTNDWEEIVKAEGFNYWDDTFDYGTLRAYGVCVSPYTNCSGNPVGAQTLEGYIEMTDLGWNDYYGVESFYYTRDSWIDNYTSCPNNSNWQIDNISNGSQQQATQYIDCW